MCKLFPYFLEKMVVVIDPDDEHDAAVPVPVSDDVMVMGPAYQIRGPMMSMMCWQWDLLTKLNPYGSLDPQQAMSKLIPSMDFQTQ